jgi:hypothetical protein
MFMSLMKLIGWMDGTGWDQKHADTRIFGNFYFELISSVAFLMGDANWGNGMTLQTAGPF